MMNIKNFGIQLKNLVKEMLKEQECRTAVPTLAPMVKAISASPTLLPKRRSKMG
jgi:hypothetical protein